MTDHHRITIGANEATAKQVVYLLPSRDDDAAHPGLAGLVEEFGMPRRIWVIFQEGFPHNQLIIVRTVANHV